jgi:hypothetical protein
MSTEGAKSALQCGVAAAASVPPGITRADTRIAVAIIVLGGLSIGSSLLRAPSARTLLPPPPPTEQGATARATSVPETHAASASSEDRALPAPPPLLERASALRPDVSASKAQPMRRRSVRAAPRKERAAGEESVQVAGTEAPPGQPLVPGSRYVTPEGRTVIVTSRRRAGLTRARPTAAAPRTPRGCRSAESGPSPSVC